MALLPVADALRHILAGVEPLPAETIPLDQAAGRVLAAPLSARLTQPPFDASAMDGYAVRGADLTAEPRSLAVIGEAAAGHPFSGSVGAGEALRIFTGAPVPDGADAIVIQEDARREGNAIIVTAADADAGHIRRRGCDFAAGDTLLAAGRRLNARDITLAAAMGHGTISVRRRPVVAVLSTGDELVPPGTTPAPGQIVASNHLGIAALATQFGAAAHQLGIARDTKESLDAHLARAQGADIVITIGGASVGDHDLVGPTLKSRGVTLDFWKVAMRPGKPLMFGRAGGQRFVGVPGNPVSAIVCARVFVVPLLNALLGLPDATETSLGRAAVPLAPNGPRTHYMRATTRRAADGGLEATPVPSQDSSLVSALAAADSLLVRPPNDGAVAAGAPVTLLRLDF